MREKNRREKKKKEKQMKKGEIKRKEKRIFFEAMIQTFKIQTRAKTFDNTTCITL
jgi:hypothetical protein